MPTTTTETRSCFKSYSQTNQQKRITNYIFTTHIKHGPSSRIFINWISNQLKTPLASNMSSLIKSNPNYINMITNNPEKIVQPSVRVIVSDPYFFSCENMDIIGKQTTDFTQLMRPQSFLDLMQNSPYASDGRRRTMQFDLFQNSKPARLSDFHSKNIITPT